MKVKRIWAVISTILLVMVVAPVANAADAYSVWTRTAHSYAGAQYRFRSSVHTSGSGVNSRVTTQVIDGTVGAGYMGVSPYLYSESGALIKVKDWVYNTSQTNELVSGTAPYFANGTYYGSGKVRFYTINGSYQELPTSNSPYLQKYSLDPVGVNNNGETFGSLLFSSAVPDLVSAVGDNGIEGYVKFSDLDSSGTPSSPDDALNSMSSSDMHINLYAVDGMTILDQFTIESSES